MTRIAFIGLGNMGVPMAANLAKAGHEVQGFDLVAANLARAAGHGVAGAKGIEDAVQDAQVVISMLPAGKDVLSVYAQALPAATQGVLFVDCSTVDVEAARAVHAMAAEHGMPSLDAPVSGGTTGAEAGALTFMCGGSDAAFAAAEPVLAPMAGRAVHCGGAGAGQAAKICNNMLLGISMIAVAEAFVLAERLGLSHQAFFDVASTSSGQCWSLTSYCPVPGPVPTSPANRDYAPGFAASLMLKDLGLAQAAADSAGAATPLGTAAADLYAAFNAAGHAQRDFSAIIAYIRDRQR